MSKPRKTVTPAAPAGEEWQIFAKANEYHAEQWRDLIASSRAQIEQVRKRDVTLRLTDHAGQPLAKRTVRVVQTGSDFLWGYSGWGTLNALRAGQFTDQKVEREHRNYAQLFNAVNLMHYWAELHCSNAPVSEEYQGFPDYSDVQRGVDWALANNLTPKGHPIFWPVDKAIPEWLHKYDYPTKLKFLEVRVRQLVSRFRGKIKLYDAVNEAIWEPSFAKTHERHWPHLTPIAEIVDYIEPVLRWAREEDPDARYIVNDYGVHVGHLEQIPINTNDGRYINRDFQARRYQELILALKARGATPDAVGIQGFFGGWGHHDKDIATLDLLGTQTGLPVHITEFCPGGKQFDDLVKAGVPRDEILDRMGQYTENALITAFGHPSVEGFFLWYNQAELFDGKGYPSRFYNRLHDLIHKQWRTDVTLRTDAIGKVKFRGFCGTYSVRLTDGPQVRAVSLPVPQNVRSAVQADLALPV